MSTAKRKMTLSSQFRIQLNRLMEKLRSTQPHYIRCIKPNDDKEALYFVPRNCFEQLTYCGVFDAVKIRKGGFPFRLKHNEFVIRYRCLLEEAGKKCGNSKKGCDDIVNFMRLNKKNVKFGKTMMLYRAQEHKTLELKRNIIMEKRKMNETLKELINTNIKNLDEPELYFERLARTIRACKRYNINTPLAKKAKQLLTKYIESRIDESTRKLLNEAIETKDIQLLEKVCIIIEQEQYETDKCKLALRLRDRINLINKEGEKAVVTLDTSHMEACLVAASELEYTNDYIDYFRWMFETLGKDSEKFVQEQMRQAVKMQDVKRQLRLNIKLKNLVFERIGQKFAINNCPILKEVEDWAGEKFGFGKDKLKAGMMLWTGDEIHSSLTTTVDKKKKKESKQILKNIQMYMGDRDMPGMKKSNNNNESKEDNNNLQQQNNERLKEQDKFGLQVLQKGQNEKEFRNEIYCQIVKQLTNNIKMQSVNRGWNLLTLCLYTFQPSQELENYLEVFIKNSQNDRRHRAMTALHAILYSANPGMKKKIALKDMSDILNGLRPAKTDFLEEPPVKPSWAELLIPFDDIDEADEFFDDLDDQKNNRVTFAIQPKMANNKPMKKIKSANQPPSSPPAFNNKDSKFNFKNNQKNLGQSNYKNAAKINVVKKVEPKKVVKKTNKKKNIKKTTKKKKKKVKSPSTPVESEPGGGMVPPMNPIQLQQNKNKNTKVNKKKKVSKKVDDDDKKVIDDGISDKIKNNNNNDDGYVWYCHLDGESGDVFYENIETGETQWERPKEEIKPTWLAHLDPDTNELYFENIDTGETKWDKPIEFCDPDEKWIAILDKESNDYYYQNVETQKASWDVPDCFKEGKSGNNNEQEWLRHFDPNSGEYYYENTKTGETQWDAPNGYQ